MGKAGWLLGILTVGFATWGIAKSLKKEAISLEKVDYLNKTVSAVFSYGKQSAKATSKLEEGVVDILNKETDRYSMVISHRDNQTRLYIADKEKLPSDNTIIIEKLIDWNNKTVEDIKH